MNEGSLVGQGRVILGQMGMLLERTGEYRTSCPVLREHGVLVTRGETDE
jgi:hypothetical protein